MNNKKTVIALLLVAIIGIVGLTIAYFANSTSIDNTFTTKEYGTTYEETFVSPDNWLPGDTTPKTLVATNTGEVDQAVRVLVTESWTTNNNGTLNGWIHSDGTKSTHTTQSELETDERVAVLNLANTSDWTKVGNYYYYNYKLAPTESTTSFLESVTFNPKTKLDDTCTTTTNNGVTTTTCNSSGDDYDNATYTLTLTIETVQYNKYATAWNNNYDINQMSKYEDFEVNGLPVNSIASTYNSQTKQNMFVFNHESTSQTPALTDYRYIGNDPFNYVYFNCDSLDNQSSSTCEVWRIIGVFSVDDGTGNYEQRIKIMRRMKFQTTMYWNNGSNNNDWTDTEASLKNFLNGDYYNRSGDASNYGIKSSTREIIGETVYYLGALSWSDVSPTEQLYINERGNALCGACGSDTTKLNWTGKIGLIYPSDEYMVYGKGVDDNCYNNHDQCKGDNARNGWIYSDYSIGISEPDAWLITPFSISDKNAFAISTGSIAYSGGLGGGITYSSSYSVSPTLYLSSSVKIIDGDGSSGNPYKLSL